MELAELRRLDYFDKFIGNYADGESKRSAISKLNLFLEDMGFKANAVTRDAKLLDIKERCNSFCKQFKEIGEKDPQECEDLLYSYFDKLKKKHKDGKLDAGTIKNRKATIRNLLKKTKIPIEWDEIFNGLPKPKRYTNDRAYSEEEIRMICKYNDKRIKPIVYTMVSSGMRLGAWDYLKWSHINPIKKDDKIICALMEIYYGTNEQYPTLITREAYHEVENWMEFRRKSGEEITGDSWVMRHYWDTKKGFTHGNINNSEKLKSDGIKSLLDSALRRQGLRNNLQNEKKRHDVKLAHGFRKFHETQLIKAGLKQVDVNIFQGHANDGMIDHYYRPSMDANNRIDDYLINEYLKAEKLLTINEKDKEISEIRKEFDKKTEEMRKIQKDTDEQIEELRREMEYQRQITLKAAELKDKRYHELLKNPEEIIKENEIEKTRVIQTGPHHFKIEDDIFNPSPISDDEIPILLASKLLKINEFANNKKIREKVIESTKEGISEFNKKNSSRII